jgi:hypothetical protein
MKKIICGEKMNKKLFILLIIIIISLFMSGCIKQYNDYKIFNDVSSDKILNNVSTIISKNTSELMPFKISYDKVDFYVYDDYNFNNNLTFFNTFYGRFGYEIIKKNEYISDIGIILVSYNLSTKCILNLDLYENARRLEFEFIQPDLYIFNNYKYSEKALFKFKVNDLGNLQYEIYLDNKNRYCKNLNITVDIYGFDNNEDITKSKIFNTFSIIDKQEYW